MSIKCSLFYKLRNGKNYKNINPKAFDEFGNNEEILKYL
jgi:hypothetical protein